MAVVITPTACDEHAVFSLWSEDTFGYFVGLYCEDCDITYPAEKE